jgi:hypothetical protein
MDFHVVRATSEISSYLENNKKVSVTSVPEFGTNSHGKNLIIDKSLYGCKTSAARFH